MNRAENPISSRPEPIWPSTSAMRSLRSSKLRTSASSAGKAAWKASRQAGAASLVRTRYWYSTRLSGCTRPVAIRAPSATSTGAAPQSARRLRSGWRTMSARTVSVRSPMSTRSPGFRPRRVASDASMAAPHCPVALCQRVGQRAGRLQRHRPTSG
jgi:hypothetical protein